MISGSKNSNTEANSEVRSGHKPSERFMRKPLKSRPKASLSERVRVADLKLKLVKNVDTSLPTNEDKQFNGYKPGNGTEAGPSH